MFLNFRNLKINKNIITEINLEEDDIIIRFNSNDKFIFNKCNEADMRFIKSQLNNDFVELNNNFYNRKTIDSVKIIKKMNVYKEEAVFKGYLDIKINRFGKIVNLEIKYPYYGDCEREFNKI